MTDQDYFSAENITEKPTAFLEAYRLDPQIIQLIPKPEVVELVSHFKFYRFLKNHEGVPLFLNMASSLEGEDLRKAFCSDIFAKALMQTSSSKELIEMRKKMDVTQKETFDRALVKMCDDQLFCTSMIVEQDATKLIDLFSVLGEKDKAVVQTYFLKLLRSDSFWQLAVKRDKANALLKLRNFLTLEDQAKVDDLTKERLTNEPFCEPLVKRGKAAELVKLADSLNEERLQEVITSVAFCAAANGESLVRLADKLEPPCLLKVLKDVSFCSNVAEKKEGQHLSRLADKLETDTLAGVLTHPAFFRNIGEYAEVQGLLDLRTKLNLPQTSKVDARWAFELGTDSFCDALINGRKENDLFKLKIVLADDQQKKIEEIWAKKGEGSLNREFQEYAAKQKNPFLEVAERLLKLPEGERVSPPPPKSRVLTAA
jgi:hypothetical protein